MQATWAKRNRYPDNGFSDPQAVRMRGTNTGYLMARHTKRKLRHTVPQLKTPPLPPAVELGGWAKIVN